MDAPKASIWNDPPEIAIPDPPAILFDGANLWLAYQSTSDPRGEIFAVVRFNHVIDHRLSPINDEGLGHHPHAAAGLHWYAFNELVRLPEADCRTTPSPRHWVVTFKDNTLDIIADHAEVVTRALRASDAVAALLSAFGADPPGRSRV